MRYLRRPKNSFLPKITTLALVVVLFVVLLVSKAVVPKGVSQLVYAAGSPFWSSQEVVQREVRGILKLFSSKGELITELNQLRDAYAKLQTRLIDQTLLKEENERLKELIERSTNTGLLPVGVLLHPNASPYDTLVIDAGATSGITTGDRVFASERIYIGVVETVFDDSARVQLLSSPGIETPVVLDTSDVTLTAVGVGGGNILLEVSRDVSVGMGEWIVLPGLSRILVGTVEHIVVDPLDAFQTVRARIPFNVYTIAEVFVEL